MFLRWCFISVIVYMIVAVGLGVFVGTAQIAALSQQPNEKLRREAEECVSDAFNCLISARPDKQHRVFSDLRKALERDPRGAMDSIIAQGQTLDMMKGEYPMPKPICVQKPGESGLPMPGDF
jgi:hypothetical protein